jgi:hypothetical protein
MPTISSSDYPSIQSTLNAMSGFAFDPDATIFEPGTEWMQLLDNTYQILQPPLEDAEQKIRRLER